MKKKMMVGIFAILLCFSLVGCKAGESKSKYPYVTVKRTMWRNDNTDIDIGGEYELNDFNKETTENGCTVTLNFDLKSKKKNKSTSETTKKENDTVQKSNSRFKLDVEPVLQLPELPTGCEITSLATVLNYYGYDISKTQLADEYLECGEVGDTDPNEKFIGSPYDIHSCGCFSNVIADAAKSFSEKNGCNFKVYNLYGLSLDDLYKYVEDGKPVVIWASPPCTSYSIAAISHHRKKNVETGSLDPVSDFAKLSDELVKHTLELIKELKPKYWFIENPRGGMRKMDFMQGLPRYTVTYCQYGDTRMKPTDIWTNHPNPQFKPMCHNGDPCHEKAPRGSKTGTQLECARLRQVLEVLKFAQFAKGKR